MKTLFTFLTAYCIVRGIECCAGDKEHGGVDVLTSAYLFLNMVSAHLPQSGHASIGQSGYTKRIMSDAEMARQIVHVLLHGIGRETTEREM